jgi:hypothetical protein
MVSPDPFSPTPSTFSIVKIYDPQFPHPSASLVETEERLFFKKGGGDPDTSERAAGGDI